MGFITNQWLKSTDLRERARKHNPIAVQVTARARFNDWSLENDVAYGIKAVKDNGDYQITYLTKAEVTHIALEALADLEAEGLFEFLGKLIAERKKRARASKKKS